MKKLIVLLLALLVATSAFAQLTINGYSRGTAQYAGTGGAASMLYRLRLNMTYNDASGNFGAWARLQSDGYVASPLTSSGVPVLKYGYAWANLLDKMVKVTAGRLANYDYMVGSGSSDYKLGAVCTDAYAGDSSNGVLVQVMPSKAINIGVNFTPAGTISGNDFMVSAKYAVDKVGNLMVNVRAPDPTPLAATNLFASGAFELTAVPGLDATACFEYGGNGFGGGYVANQLTVLASVSYGQGPLGVQVAPVYNLTGSKLYVEGYVKYQATPTFLVRAIGAFDQGTMLAATANDYFAGLELVLTVGKGYLMTGAWYDQVAGLTVPVGLRVNF